MLGGCLTLGEKVFGSYEAGKNSFVYVGLAFMMCAFRNNGLDDTAFVFNGLEEQVKPAGSDCTNVDINFGVQTATLTYDVERKVYLKCLNGTPQIDGNTQEQLAFTNVFVLETDISARDELGHKDIDWDGSLDFVGYYVSNGGVQKIHWSKEERNESSRLRFLMKVEKK